VTRLARHFDNPDLIVAAVVGDGEAENRSPWKAAGRKQVLNPDAWCVLPILHLNEYKISVQLSGAAKAMIVSVVFWPVTVTNPFLSKAASPMTGIRNSRAHWNGNLKIRDIQSDARKNGFKERPVWPASSTDAQGWTGPKIVDGLPARAHSEPHQVPLS